MNLNCLIVDDEPVARKIMQEYIADVPFLELKGISENALKALQVINSESIDLIFLDINMPRLSGIEFLRSTPHLPAVILTTAYAEYAVEGFEFEVLDYLVKPIAFERFIRACNKARDNLSLKKNTNADTEQTQDFFFVKCDSRIEKIFYKDLLCVEAMLNYVILHTTGGKMIVYLTLKGMEEQLPPSIFLKVHKSYIVNLNKISRIEGNRITLDNLEITISQNLYDQSMKTILQDKLLKR